MMPLNDITQTSNLPAFPGQNKRNIENDDDNTFLPPALSSYSLALLNEQTGQAQSHITGIYDIDFPEKNRFRSSLKSKLSVHFKDGLQVDKIKRNIHEHESTKNLDNERIRGMSHGTTNSASSTTINSTDNNSYTSNGHTNQNNASGYNSFNMSTNNYSTHTLITSEYNNELLHTSPESLDSKDKNESNTSLNGSVRDTNVSGQPLSSKASSSSFHSKRLRGLRRFGRTLGSPKRAIKLIETEESLADTQKDDNSLKYNSLVKDSFPDHLNMNIQQDNLEDRNSLEAILRPPNKHYDLSDSNAGVSKLRNPESIFFKTLKKMKSESIEDELIMMTKKEDELRRRIDEQKKLHEIDEERKKKELEELLARSRPSTANTSRKSFPVNPEENYNDPPCTIAQNEKNDFHSNVILLSQDMYIDLGSNLKDKTLEPPQRTTLLATFRRPKIPKVPLTGPAKQPAPADVLPQVNEKKKKCITINGNTYEKLELLGRGGSSKVYKVKSTSNSKYFAIKKVSFDQFDESCVSGFKGEIDLLLKLKDAERVVKLIDHAMGEGSIYLVMECGDIDLAHVLQNRISMTSVLDLDFVKYHSIEILKCVQAVHKAGIVHSDLKPANFLFLKGILKIIDFGIANAVPDHTANIYRESQIGTPNYMAPEALVEVSQTFPGLPMPDNSSVNKQNGHQKNTWKVGKPSDVWSCGCIIYQMIYGKPPYGSYSGNQRVMAIMNPQVKIQFPQKGIGNIKVPLSAIELMQKCLKRNPNERWSIEECLNSDFLKPKIVSEVFVRDLIHLAVNFGYNNRINGNGIISSDVYDKLVDTVLRQIEDLNYG